MSVRNNTKANKRFVMYIPGELRDEIEAELEGGSAKLRQRNPLPANPLSLRQEERGAQPATGGNLQNI